MLFVQLIKLGLVPPYELINLGLLGLVHLLKLLVSHLERVVLQLDGVLQVGNFFLNFYTELGRLLNLFLWRALNVVQPNQESGKFISQLNLPLLGIRAAHFIAF